MQKLIEKLGLGDTATSMVIWSGLSIFLLVIVVALAVWLVKTLRPNLNMSGGHGRGGRPQRLAITDAFTLDRDGRKLVIVRRDNIEHLLLIGGPNDLLVESNIVRGERIVRGRSGTDAELLQATEAALTAEISRADSMAPSSAPVAAPGVAPQAPMAAPQAPTAAPLLRPASPVSQTKPAPSAQPQNPAPRLDGEFERALAAMQAAQRRGQVRAARNAHIGLGHEIRFRQIQSYR